MATNTAAERLGKLRGLMARYGYDAYIVADADPHSSEYMADHWKARSWLTGFNGSNGTVAVTRDEAALWTDGRYYIQAESQLAGSGIALMRAGEPGTPTYAAWLAEKMPAKSTVGVNGRVFSCAAYDELRGALDKRGAAVAIDRDLIGEIWTDGRPGPPAEPIFSHDLRYAGKPASEKVDDIRAELRRRGATYALICGLEDVAWLFNFRGGDMPYLPVAYGFALISPDGAELYINPEKVPAEVAAGLAGQGVAVAGAEKLAARLESLGAGDKISCDPHKLNKWLRSRIPQCAGVIYADEPTLLPKAIKNAAELRGHREAQLQDGAAMARFMMWVEREARSGRELNEWDAVLEMSRLRLLGKDCLGDSFRTIAGYGPNGAMMHYAPAESACAAVRNAGLMVVDSGGQYPGGTTDVTRTVAFDCVSDEERRDFTLTLKSHIALASARFLYGAAGCHVDSIARKVMWDHGLDYKCGTGHGVGCCLSVHEGPHSISMKAGNAVRLEENMIVSIEPGVYREGKHGVRTENLAAIIEDFTNEFGRFMRFEILSFCPIDLRGVMPEMLDAAEREWLNGYHRAVYEKISPLLDTEEREWLAGATRAI